MTNIHFNNPPLNEVVIGLQFENSNWNLSDFGKYHDRIRSKYPEVQTVPPIQPPFQSPGIILTNEESMPRAWYLENTGNHLIQVQKDRFFLNWRCLQEPSNRYPHFRNLYEHFQKEWKEFNSYISSEKSNSLLPKYYELTYVNHLIKGVHWNKPNDLSDYFNYLNFLKDFPKTGLLDLDIHYSRDSYPIRNSIKKAVQQNNNKEIFVFEFSISEK